MTGNGNENGLKGMSPRGKFAVRSFGLGISELSSMGVSLGTVAIIDQVAPNLVKSASQALAKVVFEPYLEHIENFMTKVCRLQECKPDANISRKERAENLARITVLWLPAFAASFAAKIVARRLVDHSTGVKKIEGFSVAKLLKPDLSRHELSIVGWDEGVHIGSMLLMNTAGAQISDEMLRSTKNILRKVGFSEQKAKDIASMAVVWELPNMLGLGAAIGEVAHQELGHGIKR